MLIEEREAAKVLTLEEIELRNYASASRRMGPEADLCFLNVEKERFDAEDIACSKMSLFELAGIRRDEGFFGEMAFEIANDTKNRLAYLEEIRSRINGCLNQAEQATDLAKMQELYSRIAALLNLADALDRRFPEARERLVVVGERISDRMESLQQLVPSADPGKRISGYPQPERKTVMGNYGYVMATVMVLIIASLARIAYRWEFATADTRPNAAESDFLVESVNPKLADATEVLLIAEEQSEPAKEQMQEVSETDSPPVVEPVAVVSTVVVRPQIGGLDVSEVDGYVIGQMEEPSEMAWIALLWQEGNQSVPNKKFLAEYRDFQFWSRENSGEVPEALKEEVLRRREELLAKLYLKAGSEAHVEPMYENDDHRRSLESKREFLRRIPRQ